MPRLLKCIYFLCCCPVSVLQCAKLDKWIIGWVPRVTWLQVQLKIKDETSLAEPTEHTSKWTVSLWVWAQGTTIESMSKLKFIEVVSQIALNPSHANCRGMPCGLFSENVAFFVTYLDKLNAKTKWDQYQMIELKLYMFWKSSAILHGLL